ncbi:MAG: hypothetical protein H6600_08365 [Flavobacteriales bacterium]|nr:hypothetical protein [Flavobacteriales bacterium]MCB9198458.1 hypothetical protein [Flavobacteriales bacterium]
MKKFLVIPSILVSTSLAFSQSVGINSTGANPDASAMLDISSSSQGVLVPRVALTATNAAGPVTGPATSLLVYNTATAGAAPNNVTPGFYYWDGSAWVRFSEDGDNWKLDGNTGTTASASAIGVAANNNFIGTTDATDYVFATNGLERMRLKTDNTTTARLGIGTAFTSNLNSGSTPSLIHLHDWGTTANDYPIVQLSTANTASGRTVGIMNFAATGTLNEKRIATIESYLTAASGTNGSGDLRFFTNNNNTLQEKFRLGPTEAVVNEQSIDYDFRVESNGNANMFFVDAANDRVSVASANNAVEFNVTGESYFSDDIWLRDGAVNAGDFLVRIYDSSDDGVIDVYENNAMNHRIHGNGTTIFNDQGLAIDLLMEGDTDADLFFLDASADRIGISNTTPDGILSVEGSFAPAVGNDGVLTGVNANTSGIGVNGAGQGQTMSGLAAGSGAAFTGNATASTHFWNTAGAGEGCYISESFGGVWRVGHWTGGGYRKILGTGSVSTVVEDTVGNKVIMNCPEAPENLFMDYGMGQLVNGFAHIKIDPILAKNIIVDEAHPMKVFIQLEGDCNGVFVSSKNADGFDVKELQNGTSNVSFSYSIVATRGDEIHHSRDGQVRIAKYDGRWEEAAPEREIYNPLLPVKVE